MIIQVIDLNIECKNDMLKMYVKYGNNINFLNKLNVGYNL